MASFVSFALIAIIVFQLHCDKFVYGVKYEIPVHKFVTKPGPAHALSQTTTSWDPVGQLKMSSPSSYKSVWDAVKAELNEPEYNGTIKVFLTVGYGSVRHAVRATRALRALRTRASRAPPARFARLTRALRALRARHLRASPA
ncbi:hypothetical protein Ddc_16646 [Ditylenchus destructor]|nr:hypothetical protein Ddc_16646 [Ditylenchus destructor]